MKTMLISALICALGAMGLAQGTGGGKRTLAEQLAEADKVLAKSMVDNVAAAKDVVAVFDAADRLFKEGKLEQSESYFSKGLQLSPWDTAQQVAYARVLKARGKDEQARQVAAMVLRTSERQAVLGDAAKLAGVSLPRHIVPLPAEGTARPCVCFVPIGEVEDWILQRSGKQLSDKLGLPVYVLSDGLALPAPQRSFYERWIADIKKNIDWDHPFVQSQLSAMGVEKKEQITEDQTVDLLGRLLMAQGRKEDRRQLKQAQRHLSNPPVHRRNRESFWPGFARANQERSP